VQSAYLRSVLLRDVAGDKLWKYAGFRLVSNLMNYEITQNDQLESFLLSYKESTEYKEEAVCFLQVWRRL